MAFTTAHIFSLPLFVSSDSQGYVHLADILGASKVFTEWDFLRTPVFPILLKLAFLVLGRGAFAVFVLQGCIGCAGILLLGHTARLLNRRVEAAVLVASLAVFPNLVAYEHILMTEVATFFFLTLAIYLVARPSTNSIFGALLLGLAVSLGYYERSSLLYLAPIFAAIYVGKGMQTQARRPIVQFLIAAGVPFLLAYPWERRPEVPLRTGSAVFFYGLVVQGVLPVNDPMLGMAAPKYGRLLEAARSRGVLPLEGIHTPEQWTIVRALRPYNSVASSIWLRTVMANPVAYLQGVCRILLMDSGLAGPNFDNGSYRGLTLFPNYSQIDPGDPGLPALGESFQRRTRPNLASFALREVLPFYDLMIPLGFVATVGGFCLGLWLLDASMLAFTAPALAFVLMHAALLLSSDRMILPVQPVLLVNLVMLPGWIGAARRHSGSGQPRLPRQVILVAGIIAVAVLGVMYFLVTGPSPSAAAPRVSPANFPAGLGGAIDRIDGAPESAGDPVHPVVIASGRSATIEGWLVSEQGARSVALNKVYGVVGDEVIPASGVERPDLAAHFQNRDMASAGFRLTIAPQLLSAPVTRVDIMGLTGEGQWRRLPAAIYLAAR